MPMDNISYKMVSYNCKGVKRSLDSVKTLCRSSCLVALQETWLYPDDIPYLSTIDSEFGYTGKSAVDTSAGIVRGRPFGGVALLWRNNVFPNVSVLKCDNPRVCAVKIVTNERPIVVVCVYMPTLSNENLPEFTDCLGTVSAIVEECGIESVYILGDFNADPSELFYKELVNFCSEQQWSCIDVEMLGIQSDTHTFYSEPHSSCSWLDHCIVTEAAKQSVQNVFVSYDVTWSDHFPLTIECDLNLLPSKMSRTITVNGNVRWGDRTDDEITIYTNECNKELKRIVFPIECTKCADRFCNDLGHRKVLDKLYGDIVACLCDAAVMSRGRGRASGGRGPRIMGWNKHVSAAHLEARTKFREWLLCGKPRSGCVHEEMCRSRKTFKSRLKWCQNHQDQIRMDALAERHSSGRFRDFWQSTNKMTVRPGLPVSVDGVSDSKGIANLFSDHFRVQSPLKSTGAVRDFEMPGGDVETRFSAKEVVRIIKDISKGKSPGHDGLSVEHLVHAGPHVSRVLAMFYSLCLSHSYLPSDMMKTVVVPIVKNKTGDLADSNNYRPISLATIVAKVFDGLLQTQFNKHLVLHDNQFGFRPKLSTESAILSLKHVVRYYTDRDTPIHACFLDLSKAFDLVSYDILWEKLESIDLPREVISIFKYWYRNQINTVKWAGAMSEPYQLECGVRQGGLTSPSMFNLYMNALIVKLSNQHVGCHLNGVCVNNINYADDAVLLSASVCGLRKLVRICEEYALDHGLKYNVTKSKCMVFEAATKRPGSVPPVYLNGVPIERVKQFKYLGHIVTNDLKDNADIERERRALCVRANMLARRFARSSREVKVTLFRAYCTSLYTCSLWARYTRSAYNALRIQFNNAFRAMMRLPRYCSASGMFAQARVDCFHATMRKRAASLVRRVRASDNIVLAMIADRVECPFIRQCSQRHTLTNNKFRF